MIRVSHSYLTDNELNSLREYTFAVGKDLYKPDAEYKNDEILAYNMTCTIPAGLDNLISRYPGFKTYINKIVDRDCNVFHFVSLKMLLGAAIEEHQDDGLDEHLHSPVKILPKHSTVFYIQIPTDLQGGELRVRLNEDVLQGIKPRENTLVRFPGTTWHGVTEVTHASSERCMLVCEQYTVSKRNLAKLKKYDTAVVLKG